MSKVRETTKQTTNGKKATPSNYDRLPPDYEPDESETAKAFMKAVRITHKRLYPEFYEKEKKRA